MEIIKKGSRGETVKVLQHHLHLVEDGIFGPLTEEVFKAWQKANGLVDDGICGAKSWAKILATENNSIPGIKKATRKINDIILHCTATPEGRHTTVEDVRRWHKAQGWSDIGYHYLIYLDGTIHEGRDINKVGTHCAGHNTGSIGVCYVGGCDKQMHDKDTRTPAQKKALVDLVAKLLSIYKLTLSNVHCHNNYNSGKGCPSFKIEAFCKEYKEKIRL